MNHKIAKALLLSGLLSATQGFATPVLFSPVPPAGSPAGVIGYHFNPLTDVGSSITVNWLVPAGGSLPQALSGNATWTFNSWDATNFDATFSITANNTTSLLDPTGTNAAILSLGIGVSPDANGTFVTQGAVFDLIEAGNGPNQTYPGGYKNIDVCVSSDGCDGASVNTGLQASNDPDVPATQKSTDTFTIKIDLASLNSGLFDLLYFPTKFQTTWGSFEPAGFNSSSSSSSNGGPGSSSGGFIPEPDGLSLLGIGLVGAAFSQSMRRRKQA